eukprot:32302_1
MATSDSFIDLKVHIDHNSANDIQQTTVDININENEPFVWMSKWIMYSPLVVRNKLINRTITTRNNAINFLFLFITIIVTIGECLWYSITPFYDYLDVDLLFPIVYCAAMITITISKFISVYYFWIYFDFQILRTINLDGNELKTSSFSKIIRKVNRRMKVILSVLIIFILALIIIKVTKIFSENKGLIGWFALLRSILYYWMFDIPILLSQFVLSIYYCKGCIFISNLNEIIETANQNSETEMDLQSICTQYRTFRDKFKSCIDLLELMLKCRICALIPWIWIDITYLMEAESVMDGIEECIYLIMSSLPIIELVVGGSAATTQYHSFKKTIYHIKDLSLQLLYLLDYVVQYPFLVKIFAKEVSFKNALKVTAAFIVAKAISYLFRQNLS